MRLFVKFDINADIIDVPRFVIDNRKELQLQFLDWLYDTSNLHPYWVYHGKTLGVSYRSDAFVHWLNEFILKDCPEKASLLEQFVSSYNKDRLPTLSF